MLVRALASALELDTKRVQFTPDLMPSDITGSLVYDARTAEFSFQPGPVFTNLLLADEINRTPPKTQSSLLEAMEERQVTVDGTPRPLPEPFLVAATQNPVEYEGTYPLPEAQLDRFLLKLTIPLPSRQDEIDVLTRHAEGFNPRDLRAAGLDPVAGPADLQAARAAVAKTSVSPEITGYVVDICRATRESPSLPSASPRAARPPSSPPPAPGPGSTGRDYVIPDDVKALALPTLRHRIQLRPEAEMEGVTADSVINAILAHVPVPLLMALTGRAALLAALGHSPSASGSRAGRASSPRTLPWPWPAPATPPGRTRTPSRPGALRRHFRRLGETADVTLTVTNPSGCLRAPASVTPGLPSSWEPGTEVAASRHRLTVPAGERRRLTTRLRPTRQATAGRTASPSARTAPSYSSPARAATRCPGPYESCHPSPAASTSPPNWPAYANSTAAPAS